MATNNRLNWSPTNHAILLGSTSGTIGAVTLGTDAQILGGVTASDPSFITSLNADFTFGGSNSGATRTFTVSNTSNTASSAANLLLTVGGSSASDATYQANISGVTTFTFGVDNSDSDAFVISASSSLGTTNIMRAATAGEITYPLQSAFLANRTSVASNVTGDGTTYTFVASTEIFDQNEDFDGTSTYTAPVTSRVFLAQAWVTDQIAAGMTSGYAAIVTSNRTYKYFSASFGAIKSGTDPLFCNGRIFADMDAGDTATSTITISGGTKVVDISPVNASYFGGHIVC